MRALVADDSGVMRKVIVRALAAVGVEATDEACNGKEAFDLFMATPYDIVVTDWNMPEMSGLELVTSIRGLGSKIPIIMVTTEGQRGQVVRAVQAGVTDYLVKPFENEQLRGKLDAYVD